MIVYLDVIFLENLCMNYIILFATGIIHKVKIKQTRCILASVIGSVYAILSMMKISSIYSNLFLKIALSIAMIYIAFSPKSPKLLIKELLIFYLTSFAFGGCAFALLYFVKPEKIMMKDGVLIGSYPIKIALLGGVVGFTIIVNAFRMMKGRLGRKDMICEVEIIFNHKTKKVRVMVDTGNMLKDPITAFPVIVIEKNELVSLIPDNILENLQSIILGENKEIWEQVEKEQYLSRFRIIPFSSLGKEHGVLLGFKADRVTVRQEEMENDFQNVIIGIYEKELSKNKSYHGLIGLEMLGKEEKVIEYSRNVKV